MKAIDLFSGAGGFTEGANKAGIQVVWFQLPGHPCPNIEALFSFRHSSHPASLREPRRRDISLTL